MCSASRTESKKTQNKKKSTPTRTCTSTSTRNWCGHHPLVEIHDGGICNRISRRCKCISDYVDRQATWTNLETTKAWQAMAAPDNSDNRRAYEPPTPVTTYSHYGPFLAPGHRTPDTGHRTPDTGHRRTPDTGRWTPPDTRRRTRPDTAGHRTPDTAGHRGQSPHSAPRPRGAENHSPHPPSRRRAVQEHCPHFASRPRGAAKSFPLFPFSRGSRPRSLPSFRPSPHPWVRELGGVAPPLCCLPPLTTHDNNF